VNAPVPESGKPAGAATRLPEAGTKLRRLSVAAGVVIALLSANRLASQAPGCRLSGRVTGPGGTPVQTATVQATSTDTATSATARATPDADGRFCLRLRHGGEYVVQVDAEGFISRALLLTIQGNAGSQTLDVQLTPAAGAAVQLDPVVARAPRLTPKPVLRGAAPGSDLASQASYTIALYPGVPGDIAGSAGVSGEYVPVAGGALSVNGQSPTGNRTTLDGPGYDARDVPAEGLAAGGVFAHPFDVAHGQFTGGEIAGRTMGGTNVWGGAIRLALEPQWRAAGEVPGGGRGSQPGEVFVSGGGGGPLLPGRLFVFGAAQARQRWNGTSGANPIGPGSLAPDSLARFQGIVEALGFPSTLTRSAGHARSATAIARLDYVVNQRHQAMFRIDARGREASSTAGPALLLSAERELSYGGGALLQITSRLSRAENEFSLRGSVSDRRVRSAAAGPRGEVWISSAVSGTGVAGAQLAFGGEPVGAPAEDRRGVEAADRLALTLAGGRHQLQVGGAAQAEVVGRAIRGNRLGTFSFASLGDLEAGRPVRFTRALGERAAEVASGYMAVYLADVWRPRPDLRLIAGLRGERYSFASPRGGSPAGDTASGMLALPADSRWNLSPRAGFTWYRSLPASTIGLMGGTGLFRDAAATGPVAALLASEGGRAMNLRCVGADVPAPQWRTYVEDPAAIPAACAGGTGASPAVMADVSGFSADYAPPTVWHSSLAASWHHQPSGFGAELRLGASRGHSVTLASDRNLRAEPVFFLGAEQGRPVFVSADAIDPASGQLSLGSSRRDPRLGVVREVNGRGASTARTVGVVLHRLTGTGLIQLYYTFTSARDQSTGLAGPAGGWATTAGDPRTAEWAATDFEQRHAVQLSTERNLRRWASGAVVWRLLSGTPFTPIVDVDINGDGLANDRAFIPDLDEARDPAISAGMAALLDGVPAATRSCLQRQAGRIAGRNSCRTPWSSFLDVQLNLFPGGPRNKRVVINVAAENVSSALDQLIHGQGGLRGWGQYPSADPVLLRAVGFEAENRTFRYQINPGFGPNAGRWGGMPFSLRIQARVSLGADPATQALVAQAVANQDRTDAEDVRLQMLRSWRNVPAEVLAFHRTHSVGLAPAQIAALVAAADTVRAESERIAGALATVVMDLGGSDAAQVRSALEQQGTLLAEAGHVLERGLATARAVLTPAQRARVPRRLLAEVQAALPLTGHSGVRMLPDF
jgi:hypothetical protein